MRTLLAVVLLLAACSCGRAVPPADAGAERTVPILNFAEVAPGVYRGAQPDEAGFRALADMGVRTVVNLRSRHEDAPDAAGTELAIVGFPMTANWDADAPSDETVRAFFEVVMDPTRRPVYVHCAHGKDRTGMMCAIYRIEVDGWTPERALEEMRSFGWHERIYGDLGDFVRAYRPRGLATPPPR